MSRIGVRWFVIRMLIVTIGLSGLLTASADAAISAGDKAKLEAVKTALEQVVTLYKAKKFEDLGNLLQESELKITELKSSSAKDDEELPKLEQKLATAQRLLKNAIDDLPVKKAAPVPTKTPGKTAPAAPVTGQVSFTKEIAPIFVRACNNCHVTGTRGGLSMRSYNDVMRGSTAGGLIFTPGKPQGSVLMEQLVTGGMPQNGNKLPDAEIMLIMKWIEQGAKFDGPDPAATLNSLVPGGNNNRNNGTPVVQATGREKISFIRDIAPLMMDNCIRCHTGQNPPGRLNMLSFSTFMRGGQSGNLIAEGNPANSLLINVLKGTAKDVRRMPDRRQPLSDEDIKKFETWITEGNKFDGDDPGQTIEFALKVAKARKMSHDELAEWRVEMANKNWATANPSNKPDVIRGKEVTVVGRLPVVKMDEATKTADDVRNKLAQALHLPLDKPLVKGKVTIFLFDKRFEYSEHARMVESRDPPSDVPAHWRYDIVDAYGCVPAPRDGDTAYPAHVAEQLAGVYIESLGRGIPRWFSVGSARMLAARIEPKSVAVKQWEDAIAPAVNTGKYDQIITARDLDGTGSALSYALVKFMSAKQNSARYTQLVEALKRGTSFDAALKQTYNTDPKKLASLCFTGK